MKKTAIAFEFTSDMWRWFEQTVLAGPVCVVDSWTYGKCEALPNPNGAGYSEWKTVS